MKQNAKEGSNVKKGENVSEGKKVRRFTQEDKTVVITATQEEESMWVLRIVGKRGQTSEWTEFFDTADEAIAAALMAIKYEGIDEFYDKPAFRYLEGIVQ